MKAEQYLELLEKLFDDWSGQRRTERTSRGQSALSRRIAKLIKDQTQIGRYY